MIKIEKNVPITNNLQGRPRNTEVIKYDDAINSMEVGDSFEVCSFKGNYTRKKQYWFLILKITLVAEIKDLQQEKQETI